MEVRRCDDAPEQFLWRGRLWQVRRAAGPALDARAERELWQVEAGRGLVGGTDVFELALDRSDGHWQLVGCHD